MGEICMDRGVFLIVRKFGNHIVLTAAQSYQGQFRRTQFCNLCAIPSVIKSIFPLLRGWACLWAHHFPYRVNGKVARA